MNIHEYQGKAVLKEFGLPVSARRGDLLRRRGRGRGQGTRRPALGREVARSMPAAAARASSRKPAAGEKGGVRLAKSVEEVKALRRGRCSATRSSRSRPARPASRSTASISRTAPTSRSEFYLSMLVDRDTGRVAFVVSTEGGMDIEAGRARHAGEDPHLLGRSGDRRHAASRPHASPRRSASRATLAKQAEDVVDQALHGLHREGHGDARDQPADRHQGRPAQVPRRQDLLRLATRSTATPTSWRCAT